MHSYSRSDLSIHFPLLRHGDELQAVSSDISHRLAEYPTGHLHWKFACPSLIITSHVPPFWQRGAVRQGFGSSQNSPTYRDVQLWDEINNWNELSETSDLSEREVSLIYDETYLQYEFPIPFDLQIPLFLQGEGLQDRKPVFFRESTRVKSKWLIQFCYLMTLMPFY